MKQSVIMQSYLGEYPGSRKDPERKFIRAVFSFLNQTHQDKELIIVSDGCKITEKLYYNNLSKLSNLIKFHYLDSDDAKMYDEISGEKIYKGSAKKIGCEIATGEIISYLDSDDIILKNRLSEIDSAWNFNGKDAIYGGCNSLIHPITDIHNYIEYMGEKNNKFSIEIEKIKEYGIDQIFFHRKHAYNIYYTPTVFHTHRSNIDIKWEDSIGVNEDYLFFDKIWNKYEARCFKINTSSYIVCHSSGKWDI